MMEIEQVKLYLPYSLQIMSKRHFVKYGETTKLILNGLSKTVEGDWQYEFIVSMEDRDLLFAPVTEKGFMPILRPLEYSQKTFTKKNELKNLGLLDEWEDSLNKQVLSNDLPYFVWQTLIQHHFDVFGLIQKGQAIDFNKL